ncbi:MAG TPA: uracil phosphoribosyltransferase [Clostridiales bacterium UBA8153]|nr:uracil phosphoribosyltransferase [Clostridiales bacterium UBA8153]
MNRVQVLDHPFIQDRLARLRDAGTGTGEFRDLVRDVSSLMAYELWRDWPLAEIPVRTPLETTRCRVLAGRKVAVAGILRAGLPMIEGVLRLLPQAAVGHIGVYRNPENLEPVQYSCTLPEDAGERRWLVVDPMVATGGSMCRALDLVRASGAGEVTAMCLVAAPEGIARVQRSHPGVPVFTAAVDSHLDESGYIVPGLGDAGDRMFGTK